MIRDGDMTFEAECKTPLETYEWDNPWWEHNENTTAPRVLYIGDSISRGIRDVINRMAAGQVLFDNFATSKALDNPFLQPSIGTFAAQQHHTEVILFNNGLHGWHLEDEDAYPRHYEAMLQYLLQQMPGVPLYVVLSTAAAKPETDARVKVRNVAARRLAEKYNLPVIDLYSIVDANRDKLTDGVHLNPAGYELLATELLQQVQAVIHVK